MTASENLRVAIIGAGHISEQYLNTLTRAPGIEIAAIGALSRASAEKRAAQFDIPMVTDPLQIIDDSHVQAIVNLTPPSAHASITRAALEAGRHVWSEKPLAPTVKEAADLAALARAQDVRLGVAPDTFLGSAHQRALAAIQRGDIGRAFSANAMVRYWGPDAWHPNPAFLFEHGAGPVFDMGPYWITLLVQALGSVTRVVARGGITRTERIVQSGPLEGSVITPTVPTHVTALLEHTSGAVSTCTFTFDSEFRDFSLEVLGDAGAIEFADPNGFDGDPALIWRGERTPLGGYESLVGAGRGIGLIDLHRSVQRHEPHRASAELALHVLETMVAIEDAVETGATTEVASRVDPVPALPPNWRPLAAQE